MLSSGIYECLFIIVCLNAGIKHWLNELNWMLLWEDLDYVFMQEKLLSLFSKCES